MLFDQPPAELPVATLRSRDVGSQFLIDVRYWLAARWEWFRPRTIPFVVAAAGMIAVIVSANYLRDFQNPLPERLDERVVVPKLEPAAPVIVISVDGDQQLRSTLVDPLAAAARRCGGFRR